jgi:hypothetical protein
LRTSASIGPHHPSPADRVRDTRVFRAILPPSAVAGNDGAGSVLSARVRA